MAITLKIMATLTLVPFLAISRPLMESSRESYTGSVFLRIIKHSELTLLRVKRNGVRLGACPRGKSWLPGGQCLRPRPSSEEDPSDITIIPKTQVPSITNKYINTSTTLAVTGTRNTKANDINKATKFESDVVTAKTIKAHTVTTSPITTNEISTNEPHITKKLTSKTVPANTAKISSNRADPITSHTIKHIGAVPTATVPDKTIKNNKTLDVTMTTSTQIADLVTQKMITTPRFAIIKTESTTAKAITTKAIITSGKDITSKAISTTTKDFTTETIKPKEVTTTDITTNDITSEMNTLNDKNKLVTKSDENVDLLLKSTDIEQWILIVIACVGAIILLWSLVCLFRYRRMQSYLRRYQYEEDMLMQGQ